MSTNAALAFGAPEGERPAMLSQLVASGRMTGLQQTFVPTSTDIGPSVTLLISLFRDAPEAAAAASTASPPGVDGTEETLSGPVLGNGARYLRIQTEDGGAAFAIAWSRGPLFLAVTFSGQDSVPATGTQFAIALDLRAAAVGDLRPLPANQVPDESAELGWASELDTRQLPAEVVPAGFHRAGAYLWSNEELVLDSRQPASAADLLAGYQGRITGEVEYFSDDRSRTVLSSVYTIFRDAAGAQAFVREDPLVSGVRQAVLPLPAPVQLGEELASFESVLSWPGGELRESYTVQWRYGAVLLAIILNQPAGRAVPKYLAYVAAALDRAFLANPVQPGS